MMMSKKSYYVIIVMTILIMMMMMLMVQVTFWGGDALELCRVGLPRDLLFDVVDTSNLSDHVGLLNILVCCARRLKK